MSDTAVELDNVTKTFDDVVAVDRVTLHVPRGQTLGLIGPNGAGKTTLLRLISSLARPDRGVTVQSRFESKEQIRRATDLTTSPAINENRQHTSPRRRQMRISHFGLSVGWRESTPEDRAGRSSTGIVPEYFRGDPATCGRERRTTGSR